MSEMWTYDPDVEPPDQPVIGFDVVTEDESSIGTVDAAVRDDDIAFLVVEHGRLLAKHRVVIPAGFVKQINLGAEKVFLRGTAEAFDDAPEYDDNWRSDPTWRDTAAGHFHP